MNNFLGRKMSFWEILLSNKERLPKHKEKSEVACHNRWKSQLRDLEGWSVFNFSDLGSFST